MPTNAGAVASVLLALAPGYLLIAVWARARTWRGSAGDLRTVLQSLLGSAVVHLVVSPFTIWWLLPKRDELVDYPERVAGWALLVVVVVPIVLGRIGGAITELSPFEQGRPSIWDWLFAQCPPHGRFLVVEFGDGRQVAGVYAAGAMATTSPDRHGLFLCPEWEIDADGNLSRPVPGSGGVTVVDAEDVRLVRVLEPGGA